MTDIPTTADLIRQADYAAAALTLSRIAVGTAFVPDSLKVWLDPEAAKGPQGDRSDANLDVDRTVNQVGLVIVKGTGLGFSWTEALEAMVVINNRPFLLALALRAIIQRTPYLRMEITESTSQRAIVTGWRRDDEGDWGAPQVATWDMERARRAKFRGFTNPDGMWAKMPQNQLLARATADDARYIGAAEVMGLGYIAEEVDSFGDYEGEDGAAPLGVPALTSGAATQRTERRRSSKRRPPPPPPGTGADNPPADPPSTDDQRTEIHTGLAKLGLTKAGDQRAKVNAWLDTDAHNRVRLLTDLTAAQADIVLARLKDELDAAAAEAARAEGAQDPPDGQGGEPAGASEDGGDQS